jgi:nitric oxide dioxygenase
MLSENTITIVKATVPVLKENGLDITRRMYQILFRNEEIKALFNQSHHGETGSQPRSLAVSVLAYAENIDNLGALGPMVERITQKHRALNILPEHYPYVGKALIQAIREVVGPGEEVIAAWTEAYGFLAELLIGEEQKLYDATRSQPGGWTGYRPFVIDRIVPESETIASFYLKTADGGALMGFQAGQYLTFLFDIPGRGRMVRNYSLSCAPNPDFYRISVKREGAPFGAPDIPAGIVSNWLHDSAGPGTVLQVSAPAGDFVLRPERNRPVVLLSGGVGLTPMMSMLETIVAHHPGLPTWYIHGTLNGHHHAMRDHVRDLASRHENIRTITFYLAPDEQDVQGRDYDRPGLITVGWVADTVPTAEADFYVCGPRAFMRAAAIGLTKRGVGPDRFHYEFFGPSDELLAA